MYCQTIRTVRYISRDDRARIVTCSLRTSTYRHKENYSIDIQSTTAIIHVYTKYHCNNFLMLSKFKRYFYNGVRWTRIFLIVCVFFVFSVNVQVLTKLYFRTEVPCTKYHCPALLYVTSCSKPYNLLQSLWREESILGSCDHQPWAPQWRGSLMHAHWSRHRWLKDQV